MNKLFNGGIGRKITAIVLGVSVLCGGAACKNKEQNSTSVEKDDYGMRFAKSFAEASRFRSPYSDGEKAAAKFIEDEIRKIGYNPERQNFTKDGDSSSESCNLIVNIPGKGFRVDKENPDKLQFLNRVGELPASEKVLDIDGETLPPPTDQAAGAAASSGTDSAEGSADSGDGGAAESAAAEEQAAREELLRSNTPGRHRMVIAAHYDGAVAASDADAYPNYDGINDNASGVAALMDLLRDIHNQRFAFDVSVVFLGAHYDHFRGAEIYNANLSSDNIDTESVIVVDGIFAGDKLYAHSGRNSLLPHRKYMMRRKLYELTDVYLREGVYSTFDTALYTNQAAFNVKVNGIEGEHLYREFTLKDSDYLPFDTAGLPVVYLQSGNYRIKALEEYRETTVVSFNEAGGMISGTDNDSYKILQPVLSDEHLQQRINAVSFMLSGLIEEGIAGMVSA